MFPFENGTSTIMFLFKYIIIANEQDKIFNSQTRTELTVQALYHSKQMANLIFLLNLENLTVLSVFEK